MPFAGNIEQMFSGPAATQPYFFNSQKCYLSGFALTNVLRYKLRGC